MDVKPISSYQPQFNGSVDKSVKKYINRAIKNEAAFQLKMGTYNAEEMAGLKAYGKKVLASLSDYMVRTDKNTKFTLGDTRYENHPRFTNPISSHVVRIYSPLVDGKVRMDEYGEIAMPKTPTLNSAKNSRDTDIVRLERYCNKLNLIDPKEIDKAFYSAEKSKLDEASDEKLGFFAGILRAFDEAKLERFLVNILNR